MVSFAQMLKLKLRKEPKQSFYASLRRAVRVDAISLRANKDSSNESVKKVLADSNQKLILMVRE